MPRFMRGTMDSCHEQHTNTGFLVSTGTFTCFAGFGLTYWHFKLLTDPTAYRVRGTHPAVWSCGAEPGRSVPPRFSLTRAHALANFSSGIAD